MSYVRVSILGRLVNEEVWSINPTFDPTGEFPGTVNQTQLEAAATAIANRTLPTQLRTLLSTSGSRTGARVEVRSDTDDSLIGIATVQSTTAQAGTSALLLPPQSALVMSLRTDSPGASGRGRCYWPCLVQSLDVNGRVSAANQTAILADFKAYMTGIRSDLATAFPTIGFDLAVRSKSTSSTPHVTRIQLGNVVDTQRRRRDSLPESYAATTFP